MSTSTPSLPPLDAVKGDPEEFDPNTVPEGTADHLWYALERGIGAPVMAAAQWTSVDSREAAEAFFDDQCGGLRYHKLVAERLDDGALILPRLRIDGTPGVPQVRLDNPRPKEDGDGAIKFETPGSISAKKAGLVLAPSAPLWWAPQSWVNDPAVPVIISEGPSRELAMVTAAIREQVAVLPVTLTGVAMGTGRRKEEGEDGKARVVERWLQEDIATLAAAGKGRDFYVAFDHDVIVKKGPHAELGHLVRLLRAAGANVRVIIPPAQGEDTSAGLDDALAAGITLQQMVAESRENLPSNAKPRRSTVLATIPEDAQEGYEDQALDGEVLAPESAEADQSTDYVPGSRGRVIDVTPSALGDITSVDSLDQLASTIGLPSHEMLRLHGAITWKDVYTAKNIARGLASLISDFFRYVTDSKSWIRYDGSRWVPAEEDTVRLLVEGVTQAERDEAVAGVQGEDVSDEAKSREVESGALIRARFDSDVVTSLRPRLAVAVEDLDADRDVINVRNGTLDLRSGELRPHRPRDLITKIAPVDYRTADSYGEDEAERLAWARQAVQAVVDSTGEDKEVQDHLELIMGQGITGHRPYGDPSLVVMEGGASNGKTSRFSLLQATLGDYCVEVTPSVFREESSSSNERADLWGARIVIVEELTSRGGSIDGQTIKSIVGKDSIRVRPLYSKWLTVPMNARIFGSTNDQLRILDDDLGMWRRLQRVLHPYTYVEDPKGPRQRKRDVRMETIGEDRYVREEWLRLLLRGAMRWYQMPDRALPSHRGWPERIIRDTAVWRTDENPLGRMIADLLEPCEGAVIPLRDLRAAANAWRRANDSDGAARRPWTDQTIRTGVIQSSTVRDEWGVETRQARMTAEREKDRSAPMIRDHRDVVRRMKPRHIDNREVMAFGMKFSDYVLNLNDFEW